MPPQDGASKRLERYLNRSLFDALALGPRAALGALADAASVPGRLGDVARRLVDLASDPRPVTDKPAAVADELSSALLELVENGEDKVREGCAGIWPTGPHRCHRMHATEASVVMLRRRRSSQRSLRGCRRTSRRGSPQI